MDFLSKILEVNKKVVKTIPLKEEHKLSVSEIKKLKDEGKDLLRQLTRIRRLIEMKEAGLWLEVEETIKESKEMRINEEKMVVEILDNE